jgi:hypothetical protein
MRVSAGSKLSLCRVGTAHRFLGRSAGKQWWAAPTLQQNFACSAFAHETNRPRQLNAPWPFARVRGRCAATGACCAGGVRRPVGRCLHRVRHLADGGYPAVAAALAASQCFRRRFAGLPDGRDPESCKDRLRDQPRCFFSPPYETPFAAPSVCVSERMVGKPSPPMPTHDQERSPILGP